MRKPIGEDEVCPLGKADCFGYYNGMCRVLQNISEMKKCNFYKPVSQAEEERKRAFERLVNNDDWSRIQTYTANNKHECRKLLISIGRFDLLPKLKEMRWGKF